MATTFEVGPSQMQWPAGGGFSVIASDAADLPYWTRGIYVGTSGDVKVTTVTGQVLTFKALAAGIVHPICAARVWATGTSAADIIGVY